MVQAEKDEFLDVFYNFVPLFVGALGNVSSTEAAAAGNGASAGRPEGHADATASSNEAVVNVSSTGSASLSPRDTEAARLESLFKAPIKSAAQIYICELLAFCIAHHSYRIRYFILKNSVVQQVLGLLKLEHQDKTVTLACVRFFRACVGTGDEFYFRYLVCPHLHLIENERVIFDSVDIGMLSQIKHGLFRPIVDVLAKNGPRYNLLNSALLELFEFVREQNFKSVITHFGEQFATEFQAIEYGESANTSIIFQVARSCLSHRSLSEPTP
eukprot:SAG31_NODE_2503_length_5594_cov_1.758326_5_plen_271_part_00